MLKDLELLGKKVRDRVTGMTGIVETVSYDLYGCIQAVVRAPVDEKGVIPDGRWLDTNRLEVVEATRVMAIPGDRFSVERLAPVPGASEKPAKAHG